MALDPTALQQAIINRVLTADVDGLERIHAACVAKPRPRPQRVGTTREAAAILNACPRTILRYAQRGKLTPIRQSARRIRWDLDAVTALATEGVSE
jgi:hypothetical protein